MATPNALKWTVAGSLVAAVVGVYFLFRIVAGGILGDVSGAGAALPAERATARSEGLPIEPAELFPNRPVDPKKNAGPVLQKEAEVVSKLTPSDSSFMQAFTEVRKGSAGDWHVSEMKAHLRRLEPHLGRIVAATKRPVCDFGKDYSVGAYVEFPEFAAVKKVVQVLCAQAWLEAREGRFSASQRVFSAAFRLAEFSGDEPVLIGLLVEIACRAIVHDQLRRVVKGHGSDPRCLAMAKSALKTAAKPIDFKRAIEGELVMGIATIRSLKSTKDFEELTGGERHDTALNVNVGTMRSAWETRYIQFWRRAIRNLPKDPQDYVAIGQMLDKEVAWEESQKSLDHLINRIFLPVFGQAGLACSRERAQYVLNTALIELLQHRKQDGRFPNDLKEIGVDLKDPFDGNPLRYVRTVTGFKMWSIDRDLRDDGGLVRETGAPNDGPGDYVVEFP